MEVDKKLYEEIKEYCKLNGIKPSEYVNSLLKKAFMEDKYGVSPFKRAEDSVIGNKAFNDAVDAEVKRILNNPKEFEEIAKKFNQKFFKDTDELHIVLPAKLGPGENGVVYTEDALKDAVDKFNKTLLDGVKEAQETEREISDYMEKHNLEPVSMEELIYGNTESRQYVQENVQIQENIQKKDVNLDKTEPKKTKKRPITVK